MRGLIAEAGCSRGGQSKSGTEAEDWTKAGPEVGGGEAGIASGGGGGNETEDAGGHVLVRLVSNSSSSSTSFWELC